MNALNRFAPLLGRVLLSIIFLGSGVSKIFGFAGTAGYMGSLGVPAPQLFLVLTILIEVGGGLALLLGVKVNWAALLLAAFLIPVSVVVHPFWAKMGQEAMINQIMFLKNLAIMGGLLALAAAGPGPLALLKEKA